MVGIGYIGYKQGDEQSGYYPGRGIGGGKPFIPPVPPVEFTNSMEDMEKFIDHIEKEIRAGTILLPLTVWDQIKKDWLGIFTIAGSTGQNYVESSAVVRDLTDETAFPKATDIIYDVNPLHIIKDPGGWSKNQALRIKDSVFSLQEGYEAAYDDLMMESLLGSRGGAPRTRLRQAYVDSYRDRLMGKIAHVGGTPAAFDLALTGLGVISLEKKVAPAQLTNVVPPPAHLGLASGGTDDRFEYAEAQRPLDVGADLASKFVEAHRVVKIGSKRESTTRKLLTPLFKAVVTEFDSLSATEQDALFSSTASALSISQARLRQEYEEYKLHANLAEKLFSANGTLLGLTQGTITSILHMEQTPSKYVDTDTIALLERLRIQGILITSASSQIQKIRDHYATNVPTDPVLAAIHRKSASDFENAIKEADKSLKTIIGNYGSEDALKKAYEQVRWDVRAGNFESLKRVRTELQVFQTGKKTDVNILNTWGGGMGGNDVFTLGGHSKYLHFMLNKYLIPQQGNDRGLIGQLAVRNPTDMKLSFRAIAHVIPYMAKYNIEHFRDKVNAAEDGKLFPNLVRSKILRWTPLAAPRIIAINWFKKNQYFGLLVDNDTFDPYLNYFNGSSTLRPTNLYYLGNRVTYWMHKKGWTANILSINLSAGTIIGATGAISIKTPGGVHLSQALDFASLLARDSKNFDAFLQKTPGATPLPVIALIAKVKADFVAKGLTAPTDQQALIYLLLNAKDATEFASWFAGLPLSENNSAAPLYFLGLQSFKKFLQKPEINNNLHLFDPATGLLRDDHFYNLFELIKWFQLNSPTVNPSLLSFTRGTVGLLEKLTQRLNLIQDYIRLFKIGKIPIGKAFFVRAEVIQLLTNKLLALIERMGGKLFGGLLTGGSALAGPLAPFVGYLIYRVGVKTGKIFADFSKALIKLRFDLIGQMFEDAFVATTKYIMYIFLFVGLVLLLPMIFMSSLISNISPIEPYSYNNLEAGVTPGPAPPGPIITGACSNGCIFAGGVKNEIGSYSGNEAGGHGSNDYWDSVPASIPQCGINIPTNGGGGTWGVSKGPTAALDDSGDSIKNYCRGKPTSTDYYGRAWDITPTGGAGTTVCAPSMSGIAYWKIGQSLGQYNGFMVDVSGFNAADELVRTIRYVHLGTIVRTGDKLMPGDSVGTVWDWGSNSHVHLEVKDIDGNILSPESTGMCAGS